MDPWKEPLDLKIGDTIIWRDNGMRNEEGMIPWDEREGDHEE